MFLNLSWSITMKKRSYLINYQCQFHQLFRCQILYLYAHLYKHTFPVVLIQLETGSKMWKIYYFKEGGIKTPSNCYCWSNILYKCVIKTFSCHRCNVYKCELSQAGIVHFEYGSKMSKSIWSLSIFLLLMIWTLFFYSEYWTTFIDN